MQIKKKKDLVIPKAELETERERERNESSSPGSFPKCPQRPQLYWPETRSHQLLLNHPQKFRDTDTCAISHCFSRHINQKLFQKWCQALTMPIGNVSITDSGFNCNTITPFPNKFKVNITAMYSTWESFLLLGTETQTDIMYSLQKLQNCFVFM